MVDFDDAFGVEKKNDEDTGQRAAIVVQIDVGNERSPSTIVVPCTEDKGREARAYHVEVPAAVTGAKDTIACCEQVRTVDKLRVVKRFGKQVPPELMAKIDEGLCVVLGLPLPRPRPVILGLPGPNSPSRGGRRR